MIKRKIGTVGVDSGQLIIVDPCYLNKWRDGEFYPDSKGELNDYDAVCKVTCKDDYGLTFNDLAMAFSTYLGDGVFSVFGYFEEGCLKKVEIDMTR